MGSIPLLTFLWTLLLALLAAYAAWELYKSVVEACETSEDKKDSGASEKPQEVDHTCEREEKQESGSERGSHVMSERLKKWGPVALKFVVTSVDWYHAAEAEQTNMS